MKDIRKLAALVLGIVLCAFNPSCKKASVSQHGYLPSLVQFLDNHPEYSIFNAALKRLGKDTSSTTSGEPYTYFIPSDTAMIHAGFTLDAINSFPLGKLDSLIGYHIILGNVLSTDLNLFVENDITSRSPDTNAKIFLEKNNFGYFINGISILSGDQALSNGVVNTVSQVLKPPTGDILKTLGKYPELSFLYQSFLKDSLVFIPGRPSVPDPLFNPVLTLLAPTNNAFVAVGIAQPDQSKNGPVFQQIEEYQYGAAGIYQTSNFLTTADFLGSYIWKYVFPNGQGGTQILSLFQFSNNGLTFQGYSAQPITGHVLIPNIVAYNGIIHIINTFPY